MQVKDLMTTDVFTVKQEAKVSEVADLLHSRSLTGIPVVTGDLQVIGLITEKELFSADSKLYFPGYVKILQETKFVIGGHKELPYVAEQLTRITAKDIMNQNVFFASPEMSVEKVAEAFIRENQSPIPVTDSNNKLLGIISRSDLIKLLAPTELSLESVKKEEEPKKEIIRPVDIELSFVHKDLSSRFAYVAKARANIWLTTAVVLFVVGFLVGVVYVANPNIFGTDVVGRATDKINPYSQPNNR